MMWRSIAVPVLVAFLLCGTLVAPPRAAHATTPNVLGLNGSSWLRIENAPDLNPTGGITIEAWVRPTTWSSFPTIVGKHFTEGFWLGLTTTGRIRFYTHGMGTHRDGARSVPLARWTHVAVTFDGTTRRYYVDGALDYEETTPSPLPITSAALGIGAEASGSFPFTGNLAEVRIWNHARSQVEIRDDLVRQIDSVQSGLVAAFTLDGNEAEIAGRYTATRMGSPSFAGALPAPPARSGPWRIPRIVAAPVTNGDCPDGEWGWFRVPLYYDATSAPAWVRLAATHLSFHVCFVNLPRSAVSFPSEASIQIDRSDDDTFNPDADDVRVVLDEDGAVSRQKGLPGIGWINDATLASFVSAATDPASEFAWSAEFSISRLLFSATPDTELGMSFVQDIFDAVGDTTAWPAGASDMHPPTWTSMAFDDTTVPPADARAPGVDNVDYYSEHDPVTLAGREISVEPHADDDVDVASLEIYVDGALAEVCDYPDANDVAVECPHRAHYAPGVHYWSALARDHVGRLTTSAAASFRVRLDGMAPQLQLSATPTHPLPGQTVRLRARATDPAGVERIEIHATSPPYGRTCDFSPAIADAVCEVDIPAGLRTWYRYQAEALDTEDLRARSGARYLIYPISAADLDGDALPDELEFSFCTSHTNADTDGDGLSDKAEILGFEAPGGAVVDLPHMSADPCRKDVFLQYDYETGARVEPDVVRAVEIAYRDHGVRLHVEEHERPRPPDDPVSPLRGVSAAYQRDALGDYYFAPERNYTHYYIYGRHVVGASGTWPRFSSFDIYTGGASCECPLSEADPQANCRASIGCAREGPMAQALRFMHELGHSVGLGHGGMTPGGLLPTFQGDYLYYPGVGWEDTNQKPNHRSTMNYLYSMGGDYCVDPTTPPPAGSPPAWLTSLDYSASTLPALVENALDERSSSAFATALRALTCPYADPDYVPSINYTCFDTRETATGTDTAARVHVAHDGTRTVARLVAGSGWSPADPLDEPTGIDWNCDGAISSTVAGSVNGNSGSRALPSGICDGVNDAADGCNWVAGETLQTMNEWARLARPPQYLHLYWLDESCYVQPLAYREAIGGVDTPLDARFAIDPSLPDEECSGNPEIFLGLPIDEQLDAPLPRPMPNGELCNEFDDDGDGDADEGCRDGDLDGISDAVDNCPATPNANQVDADGDALGDACATPPAVASVEAKNNPNGGFAISWPASTGEVQGYRVYRERTLDGLTRHVADTTQTSLVDNPQESGPWVYSVLPLDLLGAENLATASAATPVPEPDALFGLVCGGACLLGLERRRAARRRVRHQTNRS
jgi:hypothetical protein